MTNVNSHKPQALSRFFFLDIRGAFVLLFIISYIATVFLFYLYDFSEPI